MRGASLLSAAVTLAALTALTSAGTGPGQTPSAGPEPLVWMADQIPTGPGAAATAQPPTSGTLPLIRDGAPASAGRVGGLPAIGASTETVVMPGASGDVADDMAVWRNPDHPELSLIVADNKADSGGGVGVYDLAGGLVHYESTGQIGNVDLRTLTVNDRPVILVGANDRSTDTLRFWSLDPDTGRLTALEARALSIGRATYGFCLGVSPDRSHTYAFVTSRNDGVLEQYELWANNGRVDAVRVRSIDVGSTSESCAVDDATGALFVGEESVGIWRYDLDPATAGQRTSIDRVDAGRLTADVEGLSLARGTDGRGVLIASSQGDSTFAVYDADPPQAYLGGFTVHGGGSVDDVSDTDGLEAMAGDFGPAFPNGLLIVHDGANQTPDGAEEPASNLKIARLDQIVSLTSQPPQTEGTR